MACPFWSRGNRPSLPVGDLPPNTTLFLELAPHEMPELVERARDAGFRVARA